MLYLWSKKQLSKKYDLSLRPCGSLHRALTNKSHKITFEIIRVRRGRIGSGVCFPPQRTKERNLETTTDLFMIYSSMKNQQMSLVAFSFQRNSSLKEKSSAMSLTIDPSRRRVQQRAKLMELVCIGSQKVCIGSQKSIPSLSRADWACCKA